jgi:hypothetical protein
VSALPQRASSGSKTCASSDSDPQVSAEPLLKGVKGVNKGLKGRTLDEKKGAE